MQIHFDIIGAEHMITIQMVYKTICSYTDDYGQCMFQPLFVHPNMNINLQIDYEPAELTMHRPQNDRGWVHFVRIGV